MTVPGGGGSGAICDGFCDAVGDCQTFGDTAYLGDDDESNLVGAPVVVPGLAAPTHVPA